MPRLARPCACDTSEMLEVGRSLPLLKPSPESEERPKRPNRWERDLDIAGDWVGLSVHKGQLVWWVNWVGAWRGCSSESRVLIPYMRAFIAFYVQLAPFFGDHFVARIASLT